MYFLPIKTVGMFRTPIRAGARLDFVCLRGFQIDLAIFIVKIA